MDMRMQDGKKVGEIAKIKVPQGMIELEIVNISF